MNTQEARQRRYLEDLCHGMERFCKPIIAAVEGKAVWNYRISPLFSGRS